MKAIALLISLLLVSQSFAHEKHHHDGQVVPKYLKPSSGYNIHQNTREIVVTIDDGPTRGVTGPILDVLRKYRVKATFFVVGNRAKNNPKLLKRMLREVHIVANHTYSHPTNIKKLSRQSIYNEFSKSHQVIKPYLGNSNYVYFRAPGGVWASFVADIANRTYFARNLKGPVLWDIGGSIKRTQSGKMLSAADWACWSRGYSVKRCLEGYINETDKKKGGVVLFHDLNKKSINLIKGYLDHYVSRSFFTNSSFDFVTLNQVRL
jgi:peptidoglycan/xylan/chitin deacetylase (PgdA/CDA1 family)